MDLPVQAVGGLGIDGTGVQNQAAERRLDMAARTTEAVVEIEVPEGSIEIIAPQQADHPAAEPDAFRIAGRAVQDTLGFGEFVDLLRRCLAALLAGCGLLVGRLGIGVLSQGGKGQTGRKEPGRNARSADDAQRTMGHDSLDLLGLVEPIVDVSRLAYWAEVPHLANLWPVLLAID